MSDSQETTTATAEQTNPNAELRAYADSVKEENKKLRRQVLTTRLEDIGLSIDEGLGKAIAKEYDGNLDLADVAAYAKTEYGHQAEEPKVDPEVVNEAHERIETVMSSSEPVTPEVEPDKVAAADAKLADPEATRTDAVQSIEEKLRANR